MCGALPAVSTAQLPCLCTLMHAPDEKSKEAVSAVIRRSHILEALNALCHLEVSGQDGVVIKTAVCHALDVLAKNITVAELMIRTRVHITVIGLSSSPSDQIRRCCASILHSLSLVRV